MTQLIAHRVNTREMLEKTDKSLGIEVDIRTYGNRFVIHHDPMEAGTDFDEWLSAYDHKTLILNVKEEGLEPYLIEKMQSAGIEDYFFLDQSFPFLVKYAVQSRGRSAVRLSEFEDMNTVLTLKDKINWVWIDCFTKFPLTQEIAVSLQEAGFKTCLVSPELQGRFDISEITNMAETMTQLSFVPDAVCTKLPGDWKKVLN